jgi:hypothetical protein
MSSATEQLPLAMLNGVEGRGAVAVLLCCCGKKLECSEIGELGIEGHAMRDGGWR